MKDKFIRRIVVALLCTLVAGCATQLAGSEYSRKAQKIGVVSLAGDKLQVASERFLIGEGIKQTVQVNWNMDQFIQGIFGEQLGANSSNTYVPVAYDSAKLSRIYETSQLRGFGSNFLKALTRPSDKRSGTFYAIDDIEDDLRSISRNNGIDLLVLVTKNFNKRMVGYGVKENLVNGFQQVFFMLGIRVYDTKTMKEIAWHLIDGTHDLPKNLWPGRFADMSASQEQEVANLLKTLIKLETTDGIQRMGLTR